MLLFNIFVAINTPDQPLPSLETKVTNADLLFSKKKIISSYREFRDPHKARAYDHFLVSCETALLETSETSLLNILYHYLKSPDIGISDIQATKKLTELFFIALQNQTNITSIMSMGRMLIENPVVFSSFLRSLLLRNINANQIISSQLLQDFLRYNFDALHMQTNEVTRFYAILESFPDTAELVTLAKKTCCAEEGLMCYALDGNIRQNLTVIPPDCPEVEFSTDPLNLKHLHLFFSTHFLECALVNWHIKKTDTFYNNSIRSLFNEDTVVNIQLPVLLNYIQQQSNPLIKQGLADILSDRTLHLLVNNKTGSVFTLIPFSNALTQMIHLDDLRPYLIELREKTPSTLTFISSLFSLFEGLKRNNPEAAVIIVDLLLDALLNDSVAFDDESIHKKLRKFEPTNMLIHKKAQHLEESLHNLILNTTLLGVDDMDYITIEDAWRDATFKIQCLQRIIMFNTSCPTDKYKLYTTIACSFFKSNSIPFDLDQFCLALKIDPTLNQDEKHPYERLLYELLVNIDDASLRTACIQRLDKKINRPWRKNHSLFKNAAEAGNIGLISWLNTEEIKPTESYDTLAIDAAQKGHWLMVAYLAQYHLKQSTVNMLLHCAVSTQSDRALPQLWQDNCKHPGLKEIEQAFKLAVKNNDLGCVSYLIDCPNKPSDTTLSNAFKQALKLNHINVLKVILEKAYGKCIRASVNQVLLNAARLNDKETLHTLIDCAKRHLTPQLMGKALLCATRAQHQDIVRYLTSLEEPIQPFAIERAFREAKKLKFTEIKHDLSLLVANTSKEQTVSPIRAISVNQPLKIQTIKHTTSLHTLNTEQKSPRFTFFQPKPAESPVKKLGLNRQSSF